MARPAAAGCDAIPGRQPFLNVNVGIPRSYADVSPDFLCRPFVARVDLRGFLSYGHLATSIENEVDLLRTMAMNRLVPTGINFDKRCGEVLGVRRSSGRKQIRDNAVWSLVSRGRPLPENMHGVFRAPYW